MQTSPLPQIFDKNSKILILGSYPSVLSRQAEFYYANPRNRFWRIMSDLFGVNFTTMTAEQKTAALLSLDIALSDVVYSCNLHASADSSIRDVVPQNITEIIKCADVRRIFLNGKTAYRYFVKFFPEYVDIAVCLPSTSPANATFKYEKLLAEWQIIHEALC